MFEICHPGNMPSESAIQWLKKFAIPFDHKVDAINHIQENPGSELFASDLGTNGAKTWLASDKGRVFQAIYGARKSTRGIPAPLPGMSLYETYEQNTPIALGFDLDIKTDDPNDAKLDDVHAIIDATGAFFKHHFDKRLSVKDWIATCSGYSAAKQKQSYHLKLKGFFFQNVAHVKQLVVAMNIEGVDMSIYSVRPMRLTGCCKAGQNNRVLAPFAVCDQNGSQSLMPQDFDTFEEYWMHTCFTFVDGYEQLEPPTQDMSTLSASILEKPTGCAAEAVYDDISAKGRTSVLLVKGLLDCLEDRYATEYDLWLQVLMALQSCITSHSLSLSMFELFDYFSRRVYTSYDPRGVQQKWRSCWESRNSYRERKLTIASLFMWAKKCSPDKYKAVIRKQLVPLLNLDQLMPKLEGSGIDYVEYDERWCQDIPIEQYDTIILESGMGTGKTEQIIATMEGKDRILALATRIVLAISLAKRFQEGGVDMKFYKEFTGDLSIVKKLIISPESMWRIQSNPCYDLVNGDEIESVLAQFDSPTVQHPPESYHSFISTLQASQRVVLMDANISMRTVSFVQSIMKKDPDNTYHQLFNRREKALFVKNTHAIGGRVARRLGYKCSVAKMQEAIVERMINQLNDGKRIAFFSCSATFAKRLHADVKKACVGKRLKLYVGDMDDQDKLDEDIEATWSQLDMVIYSPCILVGVSFAIQDHFNSIFAYLTTTSVNCRDAIQAIHRVRYPSDNLIEYVVDDAPRRACITSFKQMVKRLTQRKKYISMQLLSIIGVRGMLTMKEINHIHSISADKDDYLQKMNEAAMQKSGVCADDIPDIVFINHVYNELENDIHHKGYDAVFGYYLQKFGYSFEFEDLVVDEEEPPLQIDLWSDSLYERTQLVDEATYLSHKDCINSCTATMAMKQMVAKYEFEQMVINDSFSHEVKKQLFDGMTCNTRYRTWFNNVYTETHSDDLQMLTRELTRVAWMEFLDPIIACMCSVKTVCSVLGLKNSIDTETKFTTQDIKGNLAVLEKELSHIVDVLKVRVWSKSKDAVAQVRSKLKAFFMEWSGLKMVTLEGDGGSRRTMTSRIQSYRLEAKDAFPMVLVASFLKSE
jgi:hypothetical protein